MSERTLAELFQEHFDGVFETVERGSWGHWTLEHGHLVLVHDQSGYRVDLDVPNDWVIRVSEQDWACASDIAELIYAMRDLEYARWLGILPGAGKVVTE